jgi:SAM-dependent methyltransferase
MRSHPLRLEDFTYQLGKGIYLPVDNSIAGEQFAYSDGDTAEDYILRCIRESSDVSDNSPELARHARDWSSYYHLAAGRANHLRVLDLPHDLSVLELGAGCGAISRYLGENHHEVHCIEGSQRRAIIASERCRGLDNVKVYCADFRVMELEPKYDIVLLNGVLEYAPVFFGGNGRSPEESTAALLQLAKSALTKNGILLIAIENKIGLKYWCGASEDHTGLQFDGIHGYPTPGTAITYSKKDLTKILATSGFSFSKFFSCFPDYKFAKSILVDDSTSQQEFFIHNWIEYPAENPGLSRDYNIHEGLAAKTLSDAGLIHEFANSFLIVTSPQTPKGFEQTISPEWIASKVSVGNRDRTVHCVTKFYPKTTTITKSLINYVCGNIRNEKPLGHTIKTANWISGNLLSWEVADAVMSKQFRKAILGLVTEYHDTMIAKFAIGETDHEGFPLLQGECFDFIMGNIIRTPAGLEGIDNEWKPDRTLAVDYLLYRSLCYDVVGLNNRWLDHKIADADEFMITMISTLYPQYNRKRHESNQSLENSALREVRGELGTSVEFSPHNQTVTWKRAIKTITRRCPSRIRTKIIQVSEGLNEKVWTLFADS